jgi:8-oxo-dGTP pyrophosphatase MutT (NUDIX family)
VLTNTAGTIIINQPDEGSIKKAIEDIQSTGVKAVIILTNRVDFFWSVFNEHFTEIIAGGGIVMNDQSQTLFIYRRKKWDLPKGKWDDGESIEECALREVQEETGLKQVSLDSFFANTYHTYFMKGDYILKKTVWYKMHANGNQTLTPQSEEDIEKIIWVSKEKETEVLSNTFPLIRELMQQLHA